MHPIVKALGRVLRLVGISSPEDSLPKQEESAGPPSWRKKAAAEAEAPSRETQPRE